MFSKDKVAECILANRGRRRMSREALAEKSGIPAATLASYEKAESVMSFENAWKLADAFDLGIDELFERERKAS